MPFARAGGAFGSALRRRWIRLASLSLATGVAGACTGGTDAQRPDIVLVVLDTVRADRLSSYGYGRDTTPHIDALAARGLRFTNAWSTSAWTVPAHASLFTGLYPIRHGATQESPRLGAGVSTLAEILGANGYATIGISANPLVGPHTGLARGFDTFAATWRTGGHVAPRDHPNLAGARKFLASVGSDRPVFLFLNYAEAHEPYTPPQPERSRFLRTAVDDETVARLGWVDTARFYVDPGSLSDAELAVVSDLYDAEVAHVDALVGSLLDFLESSGRMGRTLLVVTSDHGENLGDHGHFRHVFNLYGSAVRVPLVIVPPGGADPPAVRDEPVSLIDVFATLLAAARVAAPAGRDAGRDLLHPPPAASATPLFSEYYFPLQAVSALGIAPGSEARARARLAPRMRRLRSVEDEGWRLIRASDGSSELFDLSRDAGERVNLAGDARHAEVEARLGALLDDFVERAGGDAPLPRWPDDGAGPGAFGEVDPETRDALRDLGYLP